MTNDIHYRETAYGFEYGAMRVTRVFNRDGYVVISIKTNSRELQVTASPKGRRLTVTADGPLPDWEQEEIKQAKRAGAQTKEATDDHATGANGSLRT